MSMVQVTVRVTFIELLNILIVDLNLNRYGGEGDRYTKNPT